MTNSSKSNFDYEKEDINPNTFLHQILTCDRCEKPFGHAQCNTDVIGDKLCRSCYKELLAKN